MRSVTILRKVAFVGLVTAMLSAVFSPRAAIAAKVAYPNPRPDAAVTEGYVFSFTDLAVVDGGNATGTTFVLQISEYDGVTPSIWTVANTWIKASDDEEVFTWDSNDPALVIPLLDGLGTITGGLERNRKYVWRVNVDGTLGDTWQVDVPMIQPSDGAERVGTYTRIHWDSHPTLSGTIEKLLLIDWDESSYNAAARRWVTLNAAGAVTGINTARVVKTVDHRSSGRAGLREWWYLDSWFQLLPMRTYRMRVVYCNANGAPLKNAADTDYQWADGGGDFDTGWEFHTVNEIDWWSYSSPDPESVVVYWQSMWGTKDRYQTENDTHFKGTADRLAAIHMTNHHPAVNTLVVGTEELAASYGGLHNDHSARASCTAQAPWVPAITDWTGWYSIGSRGGRNTQGFPPSQTHIFGPQDRYEDWVARATRTFLQDAANGYDGYDQSIDDRADLENLQYIVLIGDAEHAEPSFYYHYDSPNNNWVATDFFYSSQDLSDNINTTPHYQVSRIPIRQKYYRSINQDGTVYDPELPVITKLRDYALLLNSEAKKAQAYTEWFHRVVVASSSTEYQKWYPFYSAFTQYFLSQRFPIGGGLLRDVFSGLLVRKYDIFSTGEERLTSANILRHISNPISPDDIPGMCYLIGRGEWHESTGWEMGDQVDVTPTDILTSGAFPDTYEPDATDGRRPLLVTPSATIGKFDNAVWDNDPLSTIFSIAETAMLAPGGPIGMVGFSSNGDISTSVSYDRTYVHEATGATYNHNASYGGNVIDEPEGYAYPSIDMGVLSLEPNGVPEDGFVGKLEFTRQFAIEYASTAQAGLGNLFNHALADYITNNLADFVAGDQRVANTVFGATLIGDCALVLPHRVPAAEDNSRPILTDTDPRPATAVVGYDPTPRYNSQHMPIHTIPYAEAGVNVTLNIETDADNVRVRVLTPFRQNTGYVPGHWYDITGEHWTYADADTDGDADPETCPTIDSACTYTFTMLKPSVYIVIVQAENPEWTDGVDDPEYRWLQERWIYIQTVNEFVRDLDANILVIDMDQHDRYYLMGNRNAHVEDFYINPALDVLGYAPGDDPLNYPGKSVLPLLNKNLGIDIGEDAKHKYQYWCANVYSDIELNADDILDGRRYYGEPTPAMLKSFQDSRGTVLWFSGDNALDNGDASIYWTEGYLFQYEDLEVDETLFLTDYASRGGRMWITSQSLSSVPLWGIPFREDILGCVPQTFDTDYTGMDGLQDGTLSTFINDLNVEGGDGQSNADVTGELDPNGIEAATIFFWDPSSGPGTISGSGSSAIQNRLIAMGGRTIFCAWPFEAIDHIGDLGADNSGREYVMLQGVGWLRNVPKPSPVNPLDSATGVSRAIILQWTRVAEASFYKVYIGLDPGNLILPGAIVDRDNPWFDPVNPTNPANNLLDPDAQYYWRIDCLNADYATVTAGDVWSFTTVTRAPRASSPNPLHMEEQIPVAVDQLAALGMFSWVSLGTADTYKVYMWNEDDGDDTLDPTTNPALLVGDDLTEALYTQALDLAPNKQYYWRVDSYNELSPDPDPGDPDDPGLNYGATLGDVWQFHTITVPPKPTQPDPTNNALNVATTKLLSWKATDRTDSYQVFVWTGNPLTPPALPTGEVMVDWQDLQPRYEFDAGNLSTSTLYYWQVRPVNAAGVQTAVDTWSFTTSNIQSPDRVSGMIPANGDAGVALDVILSWDPAVGAATYILYFGVGTPPATPTEVGYLLTTYDPPGDLDEDSTYYWRVDSVAADGVTTTEGTWSVFSTGSPALPPASDPSPADGAIDVVIAGLVFTWTGSAPNYNVYLGTDPAALTLAGSVAAATYTPTLAFADGTLYYWRVDSLYDDGVGGQIIVAGVVWSFTTEGAGGNGGLPPGGGGSS